MTEKPKISIIGAGISGLTVAHELIKKGFLVDIYEKDEEAGGMAKSKRTKNNVPTEHSWRGYGPFYYNFFDIAKQIPVSVSEGFNQYTKSEVEQHNKIDDLWTIFRNEVYDITNFVSSHPGGNIILNAGGKDVEDVWNSMGYSWHANSQLVLNVFSDTNYITKMGTLVENFSEKKTVYDNLNKKRINFDLLNNENYKQVIPSITDLIYIIFFLSKYIFSDNRRKDFYKLKLEPILKKNLSKDGYHYFIDFLAGPGYGFDKNTMSIGHYALFIEFHLYVSNLKWRVMSKPTSEAWIDPWVNYLKSLGVKFYFNHELVEINKNNDIISNLIIINNGKKKIIKSDEYVIAINPFNFQDILLKKETLPKLLIKFNKINQVNNQISFRIGFNKKINMHLSNSGFILLDSPYNITFYLQEDHWYDTDLGMDGKIKTLISGTIVHPRAKGSLTKKGALQLSIDELKEEIIHQFFECKIFVNQCLKSGVSKDNIIFKEIYDDWEEAKGFLKSKNKKWVNNFINEEARPVQKTEFKNLFLSGSHCKTSINIWTMEGAVESGKITSNLILNKYNKEKCFYYKHKSHPIIKLLGKIDNIFYKLHLKNLILEIIFIIIIIFLKKNF